MHMIIYSFIKSSFHIVNFFAYLREGRIVEAETPSYLALIFFFFMGISHVHSTVLLTPFLSASASSEKSGVQIIPSSLYFLKSCKNCSFPTFFERRKKRIFFWLSSNGVVQLPYISNSL